MMEATYLPLLHLWNFRLIVSKLLKEGRWVRKFNWLIFGSLCRNRKLSIVVPSVWKRNDLGTSSTISSNRVSPEITTIPTLVRFINHNLVSAKKAEKMSFASKAGGRKVAAKS